MNSTERERLAILETQMTAVLKQNAAMAESQRKMSETIDKIDKTLSTGKAFRLGLITALPVGGGGIGAAIMKYFGSGGPTGTH